MRIRALVSAGGIAGAAILLAASASGAASARMCASSSLRWGLSLPAPVVATTSCGEFEFGAGRRVEYLGPNSLTVPPGVNWYQDLSWYRFDRGHLVVGRGLRTYWRSHGSYPLRRGSGVGVVTVSSNRVAFSFAAPPANWKRPTLYVARKGFRERAVAVGETPLGWTATGSLVTWGRSGSLRVRDGDGRLMRLLASQVHTFVFDANSRALLFLANGRLERFDGHRLQRLAPLKALGLSTPLTIQPAGAFVSLRGQRRLVIIRHDGAVVSSTTLPQLKLRTDRVSSDIAADAHGDVVFTATRGNTAYGSKGTETVYLLPRGAHAAQPLYRKRIGFAVCERQATVAWHGGWVLYTASEGYAVAVNASTRRAIDLSGTIARLPGMDAQDFSAIWAV